jgi:hypothetical protein
VKLYPSSGLVLGQKPITQRGTVRRSKPTATAWLKSAWAFARHSIIRILAFLVQPATLPYGALLLALVVLALVGVLVIAGNLWIVASGPRITQYKGDVFYGVAWRWRWKGRARARHEGGEPADLHAACPKCGARMDCDQRFGNGIRNDEHISGIPEGIARLGHPLFDCKVCEFIIFIEKLVGSEPCVFLMDTIPKQIDRKLESGEWREAVKNERAKRGAFTLYLPAIVDRWFSR